MLPGIVECRQFRSIGSQGSNAQGRSRFFGQPGWKSLHLSRQHWRRFVVFLSRRRDGRADSCSNSIKSSTKTPCWDLAKCPRFCYTPSLPHGGGTYHTPPSPFTLILMFIGQRETGSICASEIPECRGGTDGDFGDDPWERRCTEDS